MSAKASNNAQTWDDAAVTKLFEQADKFTGIFAQLMLEQSHIARHAGATTTPLVVLDNACGTGIIASRLLTLLPDSAKTHLDLTCADLADAMVDYVKKKQQSDPKWSLIKAVKADAQDTKLPSTHYTHIFFNFGPMLLPDPMKGVHECYRMLKPGGIFGCTTWEFVPWPNKLRECFAEQPEGEWPPFPTDEELQKALSSDSDTRWDKTTNAKTYLENAGFVDVLSKREVRQTELTASLFADMMPLLFKLIVPKLWTEEQQKREPEAVKLAEDWAREKYKGGPHSWEWIAIVTTGRKPQ